MNYKKIYHNIIHRALGENRSKKDNYYENHHIIPRSLGGSDDDDNLVLLTAKEHFLCHFLLYKFTQGEEKNKMANAWFMMSRISDNQERKKLMELYTK